MLLFSPVTASALWKICVESTRLVPSHVISVRHAAERAPFRVVVGRLVYSRRSTAAAEELGGDRVADRPTCRRRHDDGTRCGSSGR